MNVLLVAAIDGGVVQVDLRGVWSFVVHRENPSIMLPASFYWGRLIKSPKCPVETLDTATSTGRLCVKFIGGEGRPSSKADLVQRQTFFKKEQSHAKAKSSQEW